MQASRLVQLLPLNNKAKNKINEAKHPHHWIVLDEKEQVAFSERPGPWLHIMPDTNDGSKSRWVHQHQDKDFIVKEV